MNERSFMHRELEIENSLGENWLVATYFIKVNDNGIKIDSRISEKIPSYRAIKFLNEEIENMQNIKEIIESEMPRGSTKGIYTP